MFVTQQDTLSAEWPRQLNVVPNTNVSGETGLNCLGQKCNRVDDYLKPILKDVKLMNLHLELPD